MSYRFVEVNYNDVMFTNGENEFHMVRPTENIPLVLELETDGKGARIRIKDPKKIYSVLEDLQLYSDIEYNYNNVWNIILMLDGTYRMCIGDLCIAFKDKDVPELQKMFKHVQGWLDDMLKDDPTFKILD